MRATGFVRFLSFALAFLLTQGRVSVAGAEIAKEQEKVKMFLGCNARGDGVELVLELSSPRGICGFLGELCFDGSEFFLLSCGTESESLNFSYKEKPNGVVLLLDGEQNCEASCTLARFYFQKKNANVAGVFNFKLSWIGESACYFISETGALCPIEVDLTECFAGVPFNNTCGAPCAAIPEIRGVQFLSGDGKNTVTIWGEMIGDGHLGVGFRVFCVDLDTARTVSAVVSKVECRESYTLGVELPRANRFCIIITPVAYIGNRVVEGERLVLVFGR